MLADKTYSVAADGGYEKENPLERQLSPHLLDSCGRIGSRAVQVWFSSTASNDTSNVYGKEGNRYVLGTADISTAYFPSGTGV